MFKPIHSLLVLLIIFIVFAVISFLPISHSIHTQAFDIKVPTINFSFQKTPSLQNKKAVAIVQHLVKEYASSKIVSILKDTILPVNVPIAFPDCTYSALDAFFSALGDTQVIHVLHYGDSQIEGDRITGYLRSHFQSIWGGKGVGFICPIKVNNIVQGIDVESQGNWFRYTLFGNTVKQKKRFYGPMLQYIRFTPIKTDSTQNDSTVYEASLTFKPNKNAASSNFSFSKVRLLYGNLSKPVLLQLYSGEKFLCMKSLPSTSTLETATFTVPANLNSLTLDFIGKDSPDIYGISFETETGIMVDNIPLRGSSGTEFTLLQASELANIYKQMNVRLLIYEFGVNVIPYIHTHTDDYEQWLYRQLRFLKQIKPTMSILVIGVSDMSMHTDSGYVSYPEIMKIRDQQRKAAFKAGCAFWDMYEAMGGENSMPVWVNSKPPLGAKDYTHFTTVGAKHMATLLYHAIYNEYVHYRQRKNQYQTTQHHE